MYHTEPPTDKTIREWYINSSRVAACALRNEQSQLTQFGKFQDTERFLIHCERHFSSRQPPSGGTWKYAKAPSTKKTWRDSLLIDMLLSAVSVLVVVQSSSEIPEGLMNNPVYFAISPTEAIFPVLFAHSAFITVTCLMKLLSM